MKAQALAFFACITMPCHAQKIATLQVSLDYPSTGITVPVQLTLDPVTRLHATNLKLFEIQGNKRIPVVFQVENGIDRKLTWLVDDRVKKHVYELVGTASASGQGDEHSVKAVKHDGALTLKAGNKDLLRYQYKTVYPPAGIDTVFRRSGFIHPLWSPQGQVLTRIQPPDHYHHYGLWNPWTHVLFEGDTIDFWNLNARQGTVRFADFISTASGHVYGQYAAVHEHVTFPGTKKEKVAIRELQTVRVYAPEADNNYYIADINIQMNCPGSPVRLLEYRYGGIGWRATEAWTKENSRVLSSEGKTRKDADGSKARWCIVQGEVDDKVAGAVMISYPLNYNHPEPLRIWPDNANRNRGDMFANFSPTKDKDWLLEPGKNHVLRYRFIVFDGEFSKEKAEAAWHYFALPPLVTVTRN
jgi:hypothetical protein